MLKYSVRWAQIFLRIGIAAVFFYAGIASFFEPNAWIGYFPSFLRSVIPHNILLTGFSIYEIALGFWLLSGKMVKFAALLAVFSLLGIIVFNFKLFDIFFRDIAILFAALALAFLDESKGDPA